MSELASYHDVIWLRAAITNMNLAGFGIIIGFFLRILACIELSLLIDARKGLANNY